MKRKEPTACPVCGGKEFSYESAEITIETHGEKKIEAVCDDSEWVCLECDEIFYFRAWYELGDLLEESTRT